MEEKAIDRNELRAVLRLSKAAKEAIRADEKFDLLLMRWINRHREFFNRVLNNPKEQRKFHRVLVELAKS
jgi:hypothetical protein